MPTAELEGTHVIKIIIRRIHIYTGIIETDFHTAQCHDCGAILRAVQQLCSSHKLARNNAFVLLETLCELRGSIAIIIFVVRSYCTALLESGVTCTLYVSKCVIKRECLGTFVRCVFD